MMKLEHGARRFLAGLGLVLPMLAPAPAPRAQEEDLRAALGRITAAFSAGDADRLGALLPTRGKIQVALPALAISAGYYSAGQCRYLLADAFRRHPVRSFHLEAPSDPPSAPQVTASGLLVVGTQGKESMPIPILFLLAREDGGWVLREIRQHLPQ